MTDGVSRRQREIWHEERERLGLVRGHPLFGREGVMRVLDGQSVQVTLLPADPLAWVADFDQQLLEALPRAFTGQMARRCPTLGLEGLHSDHAMPLVQGDPERGHRAVLAVHRNGGVTVGLSAKALRRGHLQRPPQRHHEGSAAQSGAIMAQTSRPRCPSTRNAA